MNKIMVIAEHRLGELTAATFEVIAAAVGLKRTKKFSVNVAVLASNPAEFSTKLNIAGVDEIIEVQIQENQFQTDTYEAIINSLLDEYEPSVVLTSNSIDAWSCMPIIAAKRQCGFATDVFALNYDGDDLIATRAAYGEKMHVDLEFPGKETVLITLRGNTYKPIEQEDSVPVSSFSAPSVNARTTHKRFIEPETTSDVDIAQAELLLSIGRGIEDEDNIEQFEELADTMGFTLGCSRPIADNGWLPKSRQVGQSGKIVVACNTYLAFGISGSVQHMAGMKHVPNIIAVNTDAEASIFTIAKYGVVADMFEIADELINHFE